MSSANSMNARNIDYSAMNIKIKWNNIKTNGLIQRAQKHQKENTYCITRSNKTNIRNLLHTVTFTKKKYFT